MDQIMKEKGKMKPAAAKANADSDAGRGSTGTFNNTIHEVGDEGEEA